MNITKKDKDIFDSVLKTLIYNSIGDLKDKINIVKHQLSPDKYNLLIFGDANLYKDDCNLENKDMYRVIKCFDYRWCLKSILYYHLSKTKKISLDEYNDILSLCKYNL